MKDAVLTGEFHDLVLIRLVDLTVTAEQQKRPLFPSLLEEPVFFRKHFSVWVREAMEEKKLMSEAQQAPL